MASSIARNRDRDCGWPGLRAAVFRRGGGTCQAIAEVRSRNRGLLTNLIVGVIGSFVGAAVARLLGFAYAGFLPSLVLFLFILDLVRGRSANRRWS
jgi:uncharacterized membrane protein YeaQ/YmgE (transglycosylase-associated protein family)